MLERKEIQRLSDAEGEATVPDVTADVLPEDVEEGVAPHEEPVAPDQSTLGIGSRPSWDRLANQRLAQQIEFIVEIDRLKNVLRQTVLTDGSRPENTAEHSWHIAVMALVLSEWSNRPVDVIRVVKMLLIHDIVEVDAGDTFCYDSSANVDKADREMAAARRIFGLLPTEQGSEIKLLWEEFEQRETADARFANALDRLQPMLHNYLTNGHSWRRHGIQKQQVVERNHVIGEGAEELWKFAEGFLEDAEVRGWFQG